MKRLSDYMLYTTDGRAKALDDIIFDMTDVTNALYIYDVKERRKVKGIFNNDYVYGIVESSRVFESYDDAKLYCKEHDLSNMFQIKFNNGDYIYVYATYYDYNTYKNFLTLYRESENDKARPVAIFNMANLIGFMKITFEGGEDELREDSDLRRV